ncbi:recombinase family protein [Pseudomonas aeruginosa]
MLIGYARVSTVEQELRLQLDALQKAGCERIFTDKASGKRVERPGLTEALAFARPGDSLVVWKLDRLGRTMKGLVDLAAELEATGIDLKSLTDGIDTKTPAGRFFFNVMAALAVMERDLLIERTNAGLQAARKLGKVGGRKTVMTPAKKQAALALMGENVPSKDIAASIGVSVATLYRHLSTNERVNAVREGVETK